MHTDWSRAMVDKSTDHRNGVMVGQCYFKKQIDNNFSWSVLLSTIEMTSKGLKLCSETTHLQLMNFLTSLWLIKYRPWKIVADLLITL